MKRTAITIASSKRAANTRRVRAWLEMPVYLILATGVVLGWLYLIGLI